MEDNRKYRQNPNAVYTEEETEAVLFLVKETEHYVEESIFINQTARVIWKLCNGYNTGDDIIGMFHTKFPDVDVSLIKSDISRYIDMLIEKELLI